WTHKSRPLLCIVLDMTGEDPSTMLSESIMNLSLKLYHNMENDASLKSENIFISPVVLTSSLGVITLGARQNTANQVKSLLNVPLVEDSIHILLSKLLTDASDEAISDIDWKVSSRSYGPAWINLSPDFVEKSEVHYRHNSSKVNFRDKWHHENQQMDLPVIDGALFINAMLLKPHWAEAFSHKMVDKRGFMISGTRTVSVQMMHRTEDEPNQLQFLEIPLGKMQSSLLILMPFHMEPLEKVLTKENIYRWSDQLKEQAVAVSLPEADVGSIHELQKYLKQLGLVEAVDKSKADFSGITGKPDLPLSHFLHAAGCEIQTGGNEFDENIFGREELKTPKLFYADHPFIFFVQDTKTNSILFLGRLLNPRNGGNHDEL
uniref:Serpin H1 n=1 Tax=Paramormyrops kingsleyae TaxID=1676925 RepID=A0A3B3SWZ9_9TELE